VTFAGRKKAEIVSIAVEPRFRKLGVGSTLMAYTLRELKKRRIERVELMVRASDHGTAAFYRRFGFRRVRRVPRYYEDGGDALLMTMSLVG
jgi:ribosomal-protein-alanine N-acetyltransferase